MSWLPPSPEEQIRTFEQRKREHLRLSLGSENQAGGSGFDQVELVHEALPELNFAEISTESKILNHAVKVPLMVSSMTAGHDQGVSLNQRLAKACQARGWWMGVGSQRREIFDQDAASEWVALRRAAPQVKMLGNLGLAQLISTPLEKIERLVEGLEAVAMIIHTNPLQECLQSEGTPDFRGGFSAIARLCDRLKVPVVLKETGCGFSGPTFNRLREIGLGAVDVSGYGGTHWGRIEGARSPQSDVRSEAWRAFADWGITTVESLAEGEAAQVDFELWASGGIRSGVDAAKALAMGAKMVGFAKPALEAALKGDQDLDRWMMAREFELRTAMFCTGVARVEDFSRRKVWRWRKG